MFAGRVRDYFFVGGTIASFTALATRNFTTFLAGILMASPVAGLRPMRALRSTRTSRPMPGRTVTPFFLVSAMARSAYAVVKDLATLAGTPTTSASFLINCDCVIFAAAILLLFSKTDSPDGTFRMRSAGRESRQARISLLHH